MAINIIGLDRLLARLDNIAGNEAVMQGIQKGCLKVEASAKTNLTTNHSIVTGLLRASIDHKLDNSSLSGVVFTNVEYAPFVEFGTVNQDAKPYLYPALQSNVANISNDIMVSVREAIRRL